MSIINKKEQNSKLQFGQCLICEEQYSNPTTPIFSPCLKYHIYFYDTSLSCKLIANLQSVAFD